MLKDLRLFFGLGEWSELLFDVAPIELFVVTNGSAPKEMSMSSLPVKFKRRTLDWGPNCAESG